MATADGEAEAETFELFASGLSSLRSHGYEGRVGRREETMQETVWLVVQRGWTKSCLIVLPAFLHRWLDLTRMSRRVDSPTGDIECGNVSVVSRADVL